MFRWFIFILCALFIGLQYRLWFGEANLLQLMALQEQIEQQQSENEILQQRNRQLEAEVADLKQGFSAIEERARSVQGMIKKGETFFQLVNPAIVEENKHD